MYIPATVIFISMPLSILIYFYFKKRIYFRKEKLFLPVQYSLGYDLTPLEVSFLYKNDIGNGLFAELINLKINDYIDIKKMENYDDYRILKIKDFDDFTNPYGKEILKNLFKENNLSNVSLSYFKAIVDNDRSNEFFINVTNIVEKKFIDDGYFVKNKIDFDNLDISQIVSLALSPIFLILLYELNLISESGIAGFIFGVFLSFIAYAFVSGVFYKIETKKGFIARKHVLAFKKYLEVAEKDKIDFNNQPKNIENMDKFLPYAIVLNVATSWQEEYANINKFPIV